MPDPAIAIPNLLYRYAMHFDDGDMLAAARLFDHGSVVVGGKRIAGAEPIVAMWRQWVRLYDGRPRTRHLINNPIIELAADGASAVCLSQWTVLQATADYALQPVASGRYRDRLALIDGAWCFTERVYLLAELVGDTRAHLLRELAEGR